MTNKDKLMAGFKKAIKEDIEVVAILVDIKDYDIAEIILNFRDNFEDKRDYYLNKYDENLVNVNDDRIQIIDFYFAESSKQLFNEHMKNGILRRGTNG